MTIRLKRIQFDKLKEYLLYNKIDFYILSEYNNDDMFVEVNNNIGENDIINFFLKKERKEKLMKLNENKI